MVTVKYYNLQVSCNDVIANTYKPILSYQIIFFKLPTSDIITQYLSANNVFMKEKKRLVAELKVNNTIQFFS